MIGVFVSDQNPINPLDHRRVDPIVLPREHPRVDENPRPIDLNEQARMNEFGDGGIHRSETTEPFSPMVQLPARDGPCW